MTEAERWASQLAKSEEEAFERLKEFYGTAYSVKETEVKDDILYLETYDIKNNLYSKIEVNLKTSDVKDNTEKK